MPQQTLHLLSILLWGLLFIPQLKAEESAQLSKTEQLTAVSKAEIETIIETFRLAIINKDKEAFSSLFYSENIPWIAVFSDEMILRSQ